MVQESTERQRSRDLVEASRSQQERSGFVTGLFRGELHWDLLHPFPVQDPADAAVGTAFLDRLGATLRDHVDPVEIDRTGVYPQEAIDALAGVGAFGMRIPSEYGGLGLSVTNFARALAFVGGYCQNTAAWLSAQQSIGVPQPLMRFGTEEQRRRFLPDIAAGAICAFALTEPDVGSDPARVSTTAEPTEDGQWVLNGRKLWTTNGPAARYLVVIARTPPKVKNGKEIPQLTCFVVDTTSPGCAVDHHCSFMGLRGISNGEISFHDVRVAAENLIGKPGQGLRIALSTLEVGRLSLPAAALGGAKAGLALIERWVNERVQWGAPIGKHQAVASMVASMAATTFAMEAMTMLTCALADRGDVDIRVEAALAKYLASEWAWKIADDSVQVRGGRGYETATSLRERGEEPMPFEQMLRDARPGRIVEGSSEIMRLLIAREAVDTHIRMLMPLVTPAADGGPTKAAAAREAVGFYGRWYPVLWAPTRFRPEVHQLSAANRDHLRYVAATARTLARRLFHAIARYQQKLEREEVLLGHVVDIGGDLFAMAAALAYAERLLTDRPEDESPQELADLFCQHARTRIAEHFGAVRHHRPASVERVAGMVMNHELGWLAAGIASAEQTEALATRADLVTSR